MNEKIGVYVCECGPNIPDRIDIDKVLAEVSVIDGVKTAKKFGLLCSPDGKNFLEEDIKKEELTHAVIAACSPRDHEQTFMTVAVKAGLNPYLTQLVNIREQCAWIYSDKQEATRMAIKSIRAGISRVKHHLSLTKKELEMNPDVLVIGGGVAGVEACLSLAGTGRRIYLVEKAEELGGTVSKLGALIPHQGTAVDLFGEKIDRVRAQDDIEVITGHDVTSARGFLGNFEIEIEPQGDSSEIRNLQVGAVVIATGFGLLSSEHLDTNNGEKNPNIVSALEFESMLAQKAVVGKDGKPPRSVALIHCVGRAELGYCSKVCCLYMIKYAHHLKSMDASTKVTSFYTDLCLPDKSDQAYYDEAVKQGIRFLRSDAPSIQSAEGQVTVEYSTGGGKSASEKFDLVVLAPAMVPGEDTARLADMFNLPLDDTGFFKEIHMMLDPVATPIEGVFVTGCAMGPRNIPETITQSQAAAGKILGSLIPGRKLEPEVKVSEVRADFCTGCQTCLTVCFYAAISFDESRGISVVNEAICRGCGSCVGSCPSGAIRAKHFTYPQIYREVLEILS